MRRSAFLRPRSVNRDNLCSTASDFLRNSIAELSLLSHLPSSNSRTKLLSIPSRNSSSHPPPPRTDATSKIPQSDRKTGNFVNSHLSEKTASNNFTGTFLPKRILFFSTALGKVKSSDPPPMGVYGPPIHIHNEQEARVLVHFLKKSERRTLMKVLADYERPKRTGFFNSESPHTQIEWEDEEMEEVVEEMEERVEERTEPVSREQLNSLFIVNALPFVGFGFLDNMIMIVAGEYIDSTLGAMLGLSTMAAAGIGNLISDACGVGLAHYVEIGVSRMGFKAPGLTSEQWDEPKVRRTANTGKVLGLIVGCIIGMFPLVFYRKEKQSEENDKV